MPRARNVLGVVNRVNKITHGRIYTYVLDMRLFAANIISFFNRGVAYLISQRNFVIQCLGDPDSILTEEVDFFEWPNNLTGERNFTLSL